MSAFFLLSCLGASAKPAPTRSFYEIKIYHIKNKVQEDRLDQFLKDAYLPALRRAGIKSAGVFKPVDYDTSNFGKKVYVFLPLSSADQGYRLESALANDAAYKTAGKSFLETTYDAPAFERMETILLRAFPDMPTFQIPALTSPKSNRVYELRSYEGPTENLYRNKVKMFNEGGEVKLFNRLHFNAVFYGEVLYGSKQPNLMYMTSFENKADRDKHWDAFKDAPEWKKLSALPEYQHNVSHIDMMFLFPTDYSDI